MNFILAMILLPDVQEKASNLIHGVVGTNRLPTFEDRPSLLYIDAIMRECLRWRPVLPLGASALVAREKQMTDHL
jgi:cytochrome P450